MIMTVADLVFGVYLIDLASAILIVVARQRRPVAGARLALTVAARQTEPRPVGLLSTTLPATTAT